MRDADHGAEASQTKILILYCNGIWCSRSTYAIDALLDLGHPPQRIKCYRGGMQDREIQGLTAVKGP